MKELILKYKILLTLLLYATYHYLFWEHSLGINWVLFNLLTIILLLLLNPKSLQKTSRVLFLVSFLVTGFSFVWHYSTVAMLAHTTSLLLLIAALHEENLRLLLYIGGKQFFNYFSGPWNFFKSIHGQPIKIENRTIQFLWRKRGQVLFIPSLFIGVFFLIFLIANPYFSELFFYVLEQIRFLDFWEYILPMLSITYVFFMLFGVWWILHLFQKSENQFFNQLQAKARLSIIRTRIIRKKPSFAVLGLKSEYVGGIVMIAGINILLLILNILDIQNIWIFWDGSLAPELKNILHRGTYWLIASILLSMAILIFYFRKNLNFYPNNHWLKGFAYLWIFQNGILAISVAIRCYYYIEEYGLAYKRIGVLIYLLLVFFGLFTMLVKIRYQKSFYYLLHRNTWAAFVVFVGMSLVDWDSLIVRYNLTYHFKSKEIEYFMLSRSEKTLPILYEYRKKFENSSIYGVPFFGVVDRIANIKRRPVSDYLSHRIEKFKRREKEESWQSWNWADAATLDFFQENK